MHHEIPVMLGFLVSSVLIVPLSAQEMDAGRIATAFTFDAHFSVAGFQMLPGEVG